MVILVKYWFVSVKYWFTQISSLVLFNRYLTNTNRYILDLHFKYRFIPFSILKRFNQYLTGTYRYILKSKIISKIGQISVKYWFSFSAIFNWYLTDSYQSIIAFYCFHVFLLVLIMNVFTIKVIVKENSFAWSLQRDELLQCWKFREFI